MSGDAIIVKVGTVPGKIEEIALSPGATVQQACDEAGYSDVSGYTVKKNGSNVSDLEGTTVSDGDKVLLLKQISAGN